MTQPAEVAEAYAGVIQAAKNVVEWEPGTAKFDELLRAQSAAVIAYRRLTDTLDGTELDVLILRAIAKANPAAVTLAYDDLQNALISQTPPFYGGETSTAENDVETEIVQEHQRLITVEQMAKDRFIKTLAVKYKEHGWNVGGAATKYLEAGERTLDFVRNHPQLTEL